MRLRRHTAATTYIFRRRRRATPTLVQIASLRFRARVLNVSELLQYYTYPFGMNISFTLTMVSMKAFAAWASDCRQTCADSHKNDDLGMGSFPVTERQPSSVVNTLVLRVEGQCTVSSLPPSLSICVPSSVPVSPSFYSYYVR